MENRMMGYLPKYWHDNKEMIQILHALSGECSWVDTNKLYLESYIMTTSEERIREWERWLKLAPSGTLDDRRLRILSYFQVISKLTKEAIIALTASLYDDARAQVKFEDSTIKVKVTPLPENFEVVEFPRLFNQLAIRKPSHIGLHVERYYTTWGEIKNNIPTWGNVSLLRTWKNVSLFIPE